MRTSPCRMLCVATLLASTLAFGQTTTEAHGEQSSVRKRPVRQAFCTPGVVAEATDVFEVAVDQSHVYFGTYSGQLKSVPKWGGAPVLLASIPGELILSIVVDDANVYFGSLVQGSGIGAIHRVQKGGGVTTTLQSGIAGLWQLALDAEFVYAASAGTMTAPGAWLSDGRIIRVRKDVPGAETLAGGLSVPMAVLPDGDFVYFTELGFGAGNASAGLRRVPKAGGTVEHVAELLGALALAADQEAFYAFHLTGSDTGELMRFPRSGGPAQALVSDVRFDVLQELRILNGCVFYASSRTMGFAVVAVPCSGGESHIVWDTRLAAPHFAADECLLYGGTETAVERARYR